jgi:hypothetical protein
LVNLKTKSTGDGYPRKAIKKAVLRFLGSRTFSHGLEQKALSQASGVSLPTIQRMEAGNGTVRGVIESLTKVMAALEAAGIEFINEGAPSSGGGRGVRLRRRPE